MFEFTDDCEVATRWPDSAGDRLTIKPFRRGVEEGGDAVLLPPELDTYAMSADARPEVLRLGEGTALELVVELRLHRRRLQPLAVEAKLCLPSRNP